MTELNEKWFPKDLETPLEVGDITEDRGGNAFKVIARNEGGWCGVLHYTRANTYDIECVSSKSNPKAVGRVLTNVCSTSIAACV